MALRADDIDELCLMPIQLIGSSPGIEKEDTRLEVYSKAVEGSKALYAKLHYADGHTERCIAVCRKKEQAFETFEILNSCSHQNIAKPIGFWVDPEPRFGYIVFPEFDGVICTVPKEDIFEAEETTIYGFTKAGLNISSDIIAAVKYINDHYQQEDNGIPLRPLRIEKDTVFYQQKTEGEYLVLITAFDVDIKASLDIHKTKQRNWNKLGKFIGGLFEGYSAKSEVTHLVNLLQDETVKYENLVWEAGLWDLSTKMHFIREIFWYYDKKEDKIKKLKERPALGLQNCIDKLEVNKHRTPQQQIFDRNLFTSLFFLRVFILAHQDAAWEGYSGPKVDIMDKKGVERFVLKHNDNYMVTLIREIRKLKWIETSPYLRCKNDYMRVHYDTPQKKKT